MGIPPLIEDLAPESEPQPEPEPEPEPTSEASKNHEFWNGWRDWTPTARKKKEKEAARKGIPPLIEDAPEPRQSTNDVETPHDGDMADEESFQVPEASEPGKPINLDQSHKHKIDT